MQCENGKTQVICTNTHQPLEHLLTYGGCINQEVGRKICVMHDGLRMFQMPDAGIKAV